MPFSLESVGAQARARAAEILEASPRAATLEPRAWIEAAARGGVPPLGEFELLKEIAAVALIAAWRAQGGVR